MVEVYLDSGCVEIPDTLKLPYLPLDVTPYVQESLARVLDANYDDRDKVFQRPLPLPLGTRKKSEELLDKEVRGIFMCLMASLLGDYQKFVSVLRFQPNPIFYFNVVCMYICMYILCMYTENCKLVVYKQEIWKMLFYLPKQTI